MMDPKVEAEYEEYKAAGRIWGVIDKENIKKIKFPRVPKEIVEGTGRRSDRYSQRYSGCTGI